MDQLEGLRRNIGLALLGTVLGQACLSYAAASLLPTNIPAFAKVTPVLLAGAVLAAVAWQSLCGRLTRLSQAQREAEDAAVERQSQERAARAQAERETARIADEPLERLRQDMSGQLSAVKASTDTLCRSTDRLSRATLHMTSETTAVAVAVEDAHRQIATAVSSGQEFLATITKIGAHAARSASLGVEAIDVTRATAQKIDELASSFDKIGNMTALISAIANQTNLLALNATIEAARAGDQGKGFAVVAGEVKSLATETTKAVALIAEMVITIRGAMSRANAAIGTTAASIESLNQATAEIAAAVDERVAAAAHMTQSVEKSASNVAFVTGVIGNIEAAIDDAVNGMGQLRGAARDITDRTTAMYDQLERPAGLENPHAPKLKAVS